MACRQARIWTNAEILLIRHLGIGDSETSIEIHIFLFQETASENVVWKIATILSRPQYEWVSNAINIMWSVIAHSCGKIIVCTYRKYLDGDSGGHGGGRAPTIIKSPQAVFFL